MNNMKLPEKGFYVHYKHDPKGKPFNYMYEVVGIARQTEDKSFLVLYLPMYENDWFKPADFQARPLEMFFEDVEVGGKTMQRFTRITDTKLIAELEQVRSKRYND